MIQKIEGYLFFCSVTGISLSAIHGATTTVIRCGATIWSPHLFEFYGLVSRSDLTNQSTACVHTETHMVGVLMRGTKKEIKISA